MKGKLEKNEMVSTMKIYMLKLAHNLKSDKLLKLLLVDMKENRSMGMAGMGENKQKCLILIVIHQVRVNWTNSVELDSYLKND